jgi:hypothetical protein
VKVEPLTASMRLAANRIPKFLITLMIGLLFAAPCSSPARPSKESLAAIEALHKMQAATQVGVNYQEYGRLLIEAKAKTNDAIRSLPDGPLRNEISATMDAYADAAHVWGVKIAGHKLFESNLISKYSIPLKDTEYRFADPDDALQYIWLNADSHLTQITKLLEVR